MIRHALAAHTVFGDAPANRSAHLPTREREVDAPLQTRVLIVDDDTRFRALARRLLHAAGYTVVADAADGRQAHAAVDRFHPNAALIDVQLPDTDGLTLARQLLEVDPGLRVVLTSTDRTLVDSAGLAQSGAVAFVPKDELAMTDLVPWLRSA